MTSIAPAKAVAAGAYVRSTPQHKEVSAELREVAQQFESLFTHMLMKNMRSAGLGEGAMDSEQSKFYRDMFDQEMAGALSKSGGLGIADMLLRQFGGVSSSDTRRPVLRQAQTSSAGAAPLEQIASEPHPDPRTRFVQRVLPYARKAAAMLKVAPQFLIAQAALETGWGRHPIRTSSGTDSNNVFGIKAGSRWDGQRAAVQTQEYVQGQAHTVRADFRAYDSVAESFEDYARLLLNAPRYKDALGNGNDGAGFARALQRGGYATDPQYADKILRIANGSTLNKALKALKIP